MSDVIPKDIEPAFPVHVPRDQVRSKLLELLGLDETPKEIDFAEGTTQEEAGIRVTQLTYANSLGETVPGILMTPPNASSQKLPGVVCIPGTGGSAEMVEDQQFYLAEAPKRYAGRLGHANWHDAASRRWRFRLKGASPDALTSKVGILKESFSRRMAAHRWESSSKKR